MEKNLLFFTVIFLFLSTACHKTDPIIGKQVIVEPGTNMGEALAGKVIYPITGNSRAVAVQLNAPSSFAVDWTKPGTDSLFKNVVFTIDYKLSHAMGETFTYTNVREFNNTTDTVWAITSNCVYPQPSFCPAKYYVIENVIVN